MQTLDEWLERLGLGRYADAFAQNEVEFSDLSELDDSDLREIGLPLGPRRRILRAIRDGQAATDGPSDAKEPIKTTTSAIEAERRQLTVMFIDLVGSTALSEKLDPEDLVSLIQSFKDTCAAAINRFDGYIANYLGDGILVYFGYPRAHEDDAERAIHASLEVLKQLKKIETSEQLQARIGIATGLVVVGNVHGHSASERDVVLGETPNLAARLQSLAEPDTIMVAPATKALCGDVFEYAERGWHTLKGFSEPVQAWQAVGTRNYERRFLVTRQAATSPLVGRESEIAQLRQAWFDANSGSGRIALVSGEAGIGKSRLIETLNDDLDATDHIRLSFQCSPYHTNSALHPVIRQLERAASLQPDDPTTVQRQKLRDVLDIQDPLQIALIENLLSIEPGDPSALDGMSPQARLQRTTALLHQRLFALARSKPVLVLFEDVHWIDPTTQSLLDALAGVIGDHPILVVMSFRPGFQPEWSDHKTVYSIPLKTLGQDSVARIIARIAGGKRVPDEIRDQIAAKTDGIPLYVEEVTKGLLATGQLRDDGASFALTGPLQDLSVPNTLQDSLMARLDRLGSAKDVAQTGAVFGRQFTLDQLAEVSTLGDRRLRSALELLMSSGIIISTSFGSETTYTFQHALIRDTAYESLLRRERQVLHDKAAEALMKVSPHIAETEPEVVAQHYAIANRTDDAVRLWHLAGRRDIERSANREALVHLGHALDAIASKPDSENKTKTEIDLQVLRGSALRSTMGIAATETGAAYSRVRDLCADLGDNTNLFPVLNGLYSFHLVRAEYSLAYDVAAEMLSLADETGETEHRMVGHRALGAVMLHQGRAIESRDHLQQALALYEPQAHARLAFVYGTDHAAITSSFLGMAYCLSGHLDRAVEVQQDALTAARDMDHAYSVAQILTYLCLTHLLRRDVPRLIETCNELEDFSRKHSFAFMLLTADLWGGWAKAWQSPSVENIKMLEDATRAWGSSGAGNYKPFFLTLIAELQLRMGRTEECRATLVDARESASQTQEHWALAETHRIEGKLAEETGRAAEPIYQKAVRVGKQQGAAIFALRAGVSLVRYRQRQGLDDDGSLGALLAEIAGGRETPDVLEAKQLIESFA